ncbi:hypothetical protein [Pendulispora albinea]|uniref:Uncharacterized protein n=1 Tax=Pendulispora albinea TaxID=2741071 RepID=A0ABZ2M901_9BACT
MAPDSLAQPFLVALAPERRAAWTSVDKLLSLLRAFVQRSRAPWPLLDIDDESYIQYVAERLDGVVDVRQALEELNCEDLFLAYACITGERTALSLLETNYLSQVDGPLRRIHHAVHTFEDLTPEIT